MGAESIHEQVVAQSLLGGEKFVERLLGRVRGKEKLKEIPKRQRYVGRPSLSRLFDGVGPKDKRNRAIAEAVLPHGYSQTEVARHLGLHYSTASRIVENSRNKT